MRNTLILFCLVGFLSSCTHEPTIPESPAISFKDQVAPIIISNCATSGCHDGRHEFALNSYEAISSHIKAGDAGKSKLYKVITKLVIGAMPPSGPLSDDQIRLIYVWIEQGAKNN